mgnify:CR=1 FL=1
MNKTKRVLSVVLAVLMLSSLIAALAIADGQHTVIINYVFENGKQAAPSWTATLAEGSNLEQTVTSPTVVGYKPDQATFNVSVNNITENKTYTVTYRPANVGFTVNHYLQNVADNNYTLNVSERHDGFTESEVGDGLAETYPGFAALLYNTKAKVAADGSTVVEIYYDRNYYMMSFNLDGGYGVEPIYARFGASVKVENPTKPGYTFNGWEPTVPTTVPAENTTHKAKWKVDDSVNYRVQYWQENANDDGFSYESSVQKKAAPGTVITAANDKNYTGFHYDHTDGATVAADGSSVVNVYYKRNTYTLTFKVNEGFIFDNWVTKAEFKNIKYGADTSPWWNQAPSGYLWHTTSSGSTFYTAAPDMPNSNLTIYGKKSSGMSTIHYYEKGTTTSIKPDLKVQNSGWSFTVEDYIEIPGFRYDSNKVQDNNYYLYYTRNSYKLDFNSANVIVRSNTIPYDKALSSYYFEPSYPTGILEEGGYVFAGWYTDPGCTEAVAWDTAKMPYNNTIFYAKWAPKNHTVKTFLTKEKIEENDPIDTWDNVPHGTAVPSTPGDPVNGSYVFVGWFYEENGVEKAFDFSMPIVKDLNLYAKWSSNTLVAYTIKYTLENGTVIADETTGSALAGTTLTFEAKTGDELNEGYQRGYFPHTGSHSLTMDINGNNEFTFVYVAKEKVGYTVRYLDKATGEPVVVNGVPTPDKTGETSDAIITEKFKVITGYMPDSYQKRLVLSATEAENVITFWYTKDEHHATIQKNYWIQNVDGNGYSSMPYSEISAVGNIGTTYSADVITITGFTYNPNPANAHTEHPALASGVLTAAGLELNLYYDRVKYSYTVRYVDATDNNKDIDSTANVTGEGLFGAQVIGSQKEFNGYMPADNEPKQKSIIIGTGTNEIIFYYYPCYYIGHVQSGSLNNTDTIRLTGSPENLTARVPQGYLYGGAFSDKACENVQKFESGENAINFTPVKGKTYYIWEVSETYLKPRTYAVSKHLQEKNGQLCVVELYLMTHADRQEYQYMGFEIVGENAAISDRTVYEVVNATKGGNLYQQMYVGLDGNMAASKTEVVEADRRAGYIAMYKLDANQFAKFKTDGLTFQPYWVTLDGIIVRGVNCRECTYKDDGETQINANNQARIGSNVGIYTNASQQTIDVAYSYVFEAADVEVATPEVPVTPEIPEVPEAPEMTLNSGAMYLRAQYTYEMMTNTVKFISAIDVNECIEYGFVINGEVVKCEEAAQTVDGYDANYLFGGSVNGAMLMSCNMLLDGLVDGMTLNVTPYYVALDGTTVVYGETRTLVYRQWVGLEG